MCVCILDVQTGRDDVGRMIHILGLNITQIEAIYTAYYLDRDFGLLSDFSFTTSKWICSVSFGFGNRRVHCLIKGIPDKMLSH